MSVTATYTHEQGYKFNIFYRTRGGFLRALSRSKHATLDNAVDHSSSQIIRLSDLEAYKKGNKNAL